MRHFTDKTKNETYPVVNLYVDGVEVFVGPPDVYILHDGSNADSLERKGSE